MDSHLLKKSHMREFPRRGHKPLAVLCFTPSAGSMVSDAYYEWAANALEWRCFTRG